MRNVAQQALACGDERAEAISHRVELAAECAELVSGAW